uniref:Uncharacterized protein n=1 Tax=Knipowitschia caucasica TaxID=637954 RepID=A0AAV2L3N2_KNICA
MKLHLSSERGLQAESTDPFEAGTDDRMVKRLSVLIIWGNPEALPGQQRHSTSSNLPGAYSALASSQSATVS